MSGREARAIARERRVVRIDATAKDNGHRLTPWATEEAEGASLAATRCEACGRTAAVRIESEKDGLIEWEGGALRFAPCD